jgi:uncharacterized protein YjbI with pentapeptide repeats
VADTVRAASSFIRVQPEQGEASVFRTWRIHGSDIEATLAPGSYDHEAMASWWSALWPIPTVPRTALTHKFFILGMEMNAQELIQRYKAGERDFSLTELFGADLHEAELFGAILHGADLREADLSGADLREVNLDWAILERANLSGANLSRATLLDANLPGANLSRANLSGADLKGANLKGAIMPDGTVHQ